MSDGELAAVFKGLADDADEAGGEITESIAKFTDDTATIEDANVARTLAADADSARSANAIGKKVVPDGTPSGETGPGLDLVAEEQAGGHTIGRHVAVSDADLIARNIPYAGRFVDLSAARTATADNIAANQQTIDEWLQGASPKLAIQNPMEPAGGIVYERDTQSFLPAAEVNTVIVRSSTGYYVLTSYPTP
jgi:Bacterial CdiA-CT RNAse A domain